jgi:DNA-binding NarL/FixJ family response regulator
MRAVTEQRDGTAPIVVVDDSDDIGALITRLLDGLGRPVVHVATGGGALANADAERPAVVLLDVHLPDMSGYEVCRALRERFGEQLPIMFLSGTRTESYDRVSGILLGADDYLVKPFAPDELVARVRRLLTRAGDANGDSYYDLTARERQILRLLAAGHAQPAIAQELVISAKTVATHIQHILRKIGAHSRAEAVAFANRNGLND